MLNNALIQMIIFYQKYISPHKGYCCAYRAYSGNASCSEYAKIAIKKNGFIKAIPSIKKQFLKCKIAFEKIEKKKKEKDMKENAADVCFINGCVSASLETFTSIKSCT